MVHVRKIVLYQAQASFNERTLAQSNRKATEYFASTTITSSWRTARSGYSARPLHLYLCHSVLIEIRICCSLAAVLKEWCRNPQRHNLVSHCLLDAVVPHQISEPAFLLGFFFRGARPKIFYGAPPVNFLGQTILGWGQTFFKENEIFTSES